MRLARATVIALAAGLAGLVSATPAQAQSSAAGAFGDDAFGDGALDDTTQGGIGWRSDLELGLPDLARTFQGLAIGPGFAVGAEAGVTIPGVRPADVVPFVGGGFEVRVRDWQVVHLDLGASAATLLRPGPDGVRGTLGVTLGRAGDRARTRFGARLAVQAIEDRVVVVPGIHLGWAWHLGG